jgi:hypothetical protein
MRVDLAVVLACCVAGTAVGEEPAGLPPPIDARMKESVIHLLRENRQKYGDDAAILQGLLLVNATRGGAILASEVAIEGFEIRGERRFVTFRVESGAIFDDGTYDRDLRVEQMWRLVVERSLLRYPAFSVPGDGIAVEVRYNHRPWKDRRELYEAFDSPGESERAKFYLLSENIASFLARELGSAELLERSEILVDGIPAHPRIRDLVGPPEPDLEPPSPGSPY